MRGPVASRSRLAGAPSAVCHSAVQMNRVRQARAAEHQREWRPVLLEFDTLQDFAALGYAGDREPACGHPHRAFGVHADAVGPQTLGEHPPPRQPAVAVDVERGEPARERLGDDQRPAVRSDDHAVGELDVAGDLAQLPVRRDELDIARLGRRAGDEVEVRSVDVGDAACVDDDLVRPLLGVDGHRPVTLLAADLVARRQQPAVRQPVDGVSHRVAGRVTGEHDLRLAVHVNRHDLPVDPVAEPQLPRMPPRRLRNPQATQQDLRFRHDAPLLLQPRRSQTSCLTPTRTATSPIDSVGPRIHRGIESFPVAAGQRGVAAGAGDGAGGSGRRGPTDQQARSAIQILPADSALKVSGGIIMNSAHIS